MSDRNEYTPWVELGMTELDYWKTMYLDIQVQWAPVIEAARAFQQAFFRATALRSAQRKVIEAAKAYATVRWREPYKDTADQADAENISRFELLDAVEALEEVEGD